MVLYLITLSAIRDPEMTDAKDSIEKTNDLIKVHIYERKPNNYVKKQQTTTTKLVNVYSCSCY